MKITIDSKHLWSQKLRQCLYYVKPSGQNFFIWSKNNNKIAGIAKSVKHKKKVQFSDFKA